MLGERSVVSTLFFSLSNQDSCYTKSARLALVGRNFCSRIKNRGKNKLTKGKKKQSRPKRGGVCVDPPTDINGLVPAGP